MMRKKLIVCLTFLPLLITSVYGQFSFDSCVVAYYPFNNNADDISGNNFNGSVFGPTLTNDRFSNPNNAYSFDGVNDSITSNISAKAFSVSYWLKTNSSQVQNILTTGNGQYPYDEYGILVGMNLGIPSIYFASANGVWGNPGSFYVRSNEVVNDGNWHHVVFSIDTTNSNNCKSYVDGVITNYSTTGDITTIDFSVLENRVYIFGIEHDQDVPFDGALDDIRLFNCTLDSSSVYELYTETPVSIKESSTKENISIYPIPTSNQLTLSGTYSFINKIEIYDITGKPIKSINHNTNIVNVSDLSDGVYFIKVISSESRYSQKFIKK